MIDLRTVKRIMPVALVIVFALFSCNKNNEEELDNCNSISLTTVLEYATPGVKYETFALHQTIDGGYVALISEQYSNDYTVIKYDSNFEVENETTLSGVTIKGFIPLDDGRYLFSSAHETGRISTLSADLSVVVEHPIEYDRNPFVKQVENGFLTVTGSSVLSTEVCYFNLDMEEIWSKKFDPSYFHTNFYDRSTGLYYVANIAQEIVVLNILDGSIVKTLPGQNVYISDIYVNDSRIYIAGRQGPVSECAIDIYVKKLDLDGNELWHKSFGSADADDDAIDLIVYNNRLYVGGYYATGCSPGYFGGYSNYYINELTLDGSIERCYRETESLPSYFGKFFVDGNNNLNATGIYSDNGTDDRRAIIFSVD